MQQLYLPGTPIEKRLADHSITDDKGRDFVVARRKAYQLGGSVASDYPDEERRNLKIRRIVIPAGTNPTLPLTLHVGQ